MKKIKFDKLIYGTGKSGIDLTQKLIDKYQLKKEPKSVQIGIRFEAPQKYFQKMLDISYDFKLYQKPNDKVSLRTFCLPPGEKIMINRKGLIMYDNIENITIDDKVLTYNIELNKTEFINPKETTSRNYKGKIYNFNDGELKTTKDHEIFCIEKELVDCEGIVEKGINKGKKWSNKKNKLSKINEIKAEDLNIGDRILRGSNFKDYLGNNINNDEVLDNEFYYILGLWLADGSANYTQKRPSNSIQITNEIYILEQIKYYLFKRWTHSNIQYRENYGILDFNSKLFCKFLKDEDLFKKGKLRGLPKSIYSWDKDKIYSLLSGMIDGDGRVKNEYNTSIDYFTVSDILIRDLSYLLSLLNIKFTIQRRKNIKTNFSKKSSIYHINICDRESINLLRNNLKLKNIKKKSILDLNNNSNEYDIKNYQKIYNIETEDYDGTVYDLTIPETHNFIAGRTPLVIHNCTNSGGAYVAEEETYGMKSYNGHSFKDPKMNSNMVNFGIIMELKGIDNPFDFQKKVVQACQDGKNGLYYSPGNTRKPTLSAEGNEMNISQIGWLELIKVSEVFDGYFEYIVNFINDLNKIFKFENDYGIYIPEVKFLSEEVLVSYEDLSLVDYPNIHFVGDSLSSRGIAVSAAQGVYAVNKLI